MQVKRESDDPGDLLNEDCPPTGKRRGSRNYSTVQICIFTE
jgi:hypothetical protein